MTTLNPLSLDALFETDPVSVSLRLRSLYDEATGAHGDRIVLYGVGHLGRRTLANLRRIGIEPLAFVDRDPLRWGEEVDGLTVFSPEGAIARWADDATFVVTVYNGTPVRETLRKGGCQTVIACPLLYWKHPEHCLPFGGVCPPEATLDHRDELRRTYDLLADEASREAFLGQLAWRLTLDYAVLPTPSPASETYFIPEIVPIAHEVFVDCGAFDGDSIEAFFAWNPSGRAVAVEPDPQNGRRPQGADAPERTRAGRDDPPSRRRRRAGRTRLRGERHRRVEPQRRRDDRRPVRASRRSPRRRSPDVPQDGRRRRGARCAQGRRRDDPQTSPRPRDLPLPQTRGPLANPALHRHSWCGTTSTSYASTPRSAGRSSSTPFPPRGCARERRRRCRPHPRARRMRRRRRDLLPRYPGERSRRRDALAGAGRRRLPAERSSCRPGLLRPGGRARSRERGRAEQPRGGAQAAVAVRRGDSRLRARPSRSTPTTRPPSSTTATRSSRAGRHFDAAQAVRRALELKPDWVPALQNLSLALWASGHVAEAIRIVGKAVEREPESRAASNLLMFLQYSDAPPRGGTLRGRTAMGRVLR